MVRNTGIMGHRIGQPPPQRTMFTPRKQPTRRRGRGVATTESLRYALRFDESDEPLTYREVKKVCAMLLSCTTGQIIEISENKEFPIILTSICKALLNDMKNATTNTMQWLLDRAFGKPKKSVQRIGSVEVIFSKTLNGDLLIEFKEIETTN